MHSTSNHGLGIALDLNTNCGKQNSKSNEPTSKCLSSPVYKWLRTNAINYGFIRTVESEPWHWEYRPGQSPPVWQ